MTRHRSPEIRWGVEVGQDLPARLDIVRAPIGDGSLYFYCLSDKLTTVMLHWHDKRTVPCTGADHGCICGVLSVSHKRLAYVAGWHHEWQKLFIAEISTKAVRDSKSSFDLTFESLRGKYFRMWRRGKKWNSHGQIELAIPPKIDYPLPKEFDLREALARIWNGPSKV